MNIVFLAGWLAEATVVYTSCFLGRSLNGRGSECSLQQPQKSVLVKLDQQRRQHSEDRRKGGLEGRGERQISSRNLAGVVQQEALLGKDPQSTPPSSFQMQTRRGRLK
jgi:hypothetical protein